MGHPSPLCTAAVYTRSGDGLLQSRYPYGNGSGGFINAQQRQQASMALGTAGMLSFPLPVGHFVNAKAPIALVYPQADGTTNSYSRHRWAYYDGVNSFLYEIPIGANFGSPPYKYTLLAGPSWLSIGQYVGSPKYGILSGTPNATAINVTVSVQIENQDSSTPLIISYTLNTTQSTAHFCFQDQTNGNDSTGDGTIAKPYRTLQKIYGATSGAGVGAAGTTIVMRAGNPAMVGWTSFGVHMDKTVTPMGIMAFPGESVTIDITAGGSDAVWSTPGDNTGDDYFIQGFTLGPGVSTTNLRTFSCSSLTNRVLMDNMTVPNPANGTENNDNNTTIMFWSVAAYHQNFFQSRHTETGRTGGNAAAGHVLFGMQNFLIQNCVATVSGNANAYFAKESCANGTYRYCTVSGPANANMLSSGCQIGNSKATQNLEYCYCTINNTGTSIQDYGAMTLNLQFVTSLVGQHWIYRNTIYGGGQVRGATPGAVGPFEFDSNVIVVASGPPVYGFYAALGANVTQLNTECQGLTSAGIINTTTLQLANSYTSFNGQRGANIA